MNTPKVFQMKSAKGNPVKNQFIIHADKGVYFQSYKTMIVFKPEAGPIQLDKTYWKWSVTTSKYRGQFLGEHSGITQDKIDSGEYVLVDLNGG